MSPQAVQKEPGKNPDIDQDVGSSGVALRSRTLSPVPYLGAREGAASGGSTGKLSMKVTRFRQSR